MIEAPVFHVNGDDPEAVCFVGALAAEFRQTFGRDVVIDMYCYRRYGHNEGDEPVYTQPDLYAKITRQPSVGTLYGEKLAKDGSVSKEDADGMIKAYEANCDAVLATVRTAARGSGQWVKKGVCWFDGHFPAAVFARAGRDSHHTGNARQGGDGGDARAGFHQNSTQAQNARCWIGASRSSRRADLTTGRSPRRWRSGRCCWTASRCA